ncbi:hypothetical protein K3495_g15345, partial [Podosphaera aphanis]
MAEQEQDVFFSSHMALVDTHPSKYNDYTFYFWSHNIWIADSGASAHVANRREMFTTFTPCKRVLNVAGGLTAVIEGTGVVHMKGLVNGIHREFRLVDVLYVPTARFCLISGPKIDTAGGKLDFESGTCNFWNSKGTFIVTGRLDGNLYRVNAKALLNQMPIANTALTQTMSWHEAHKRLGHISLSSMKIIFGKELVNGIKLDQKSIPISLGCESCIAAKAHKTPYPLHSLKRTEMFGDLTHSDVWGSPNVKHTPGGNQYFILFIDDYTRYITVELMKNKASVKQKLMNYCSYIHTQHNRWPKEIKADNAAEFEGTRSWMEERGIKFMP